MSDNFPINHFFSFEDKQKNNNKINNLDINSAFNSPSEKAVNKVNLQDGFLTADPSNIEICEDFDTEELKSISEEIISSLKETIQPNKFKTFFENTFTVTQITENTIIFSVSTKFIKKMIENFYISTIKQIVFSLLGNNYEVIIKLMNTNQDSNNFKDLESIEPINKETKHKKASFKLNSLNSNISVNDKVNSEVRKVMKTNQNLGNKIDDKKTFDNFIIGPSNNMAHAFSYAVAKDPGIVYPQLYIYGNSGLGKTHLLHAICNYIKDKDPTKRICLTTATDFMQEMVMAIQGSMKGSDKVNEFRRKYTDLVDVLIIDDIHELQGKARTQSEFFYIFNELQAKNKQLIFTSDKQPNEIKGLEDRISSRLCSAILVDIQQPDIETRIAILKCKAAEKDIFLDDDVINLIAQSVKSNVRELEGKLIKLGAYSDLMNVDIDLEIAKKQLNITNDLNEKVIDINKITTTVADYFKIPLGDIIGKTRKKDIALARHISMFMSHKILKLTLEEIGLYFDKRDHSTVIHGIKKIDELIKKDSSLSQKIYEIESNL
jgi:chromosomal replication initiator protein